MKSLFWKWLLGPIFYLSATLALHGPSAAGSIETACRAAVRAEMKGPNCRMSEISEISTGTFHPCAVLGGQLAAFNDKIAQCVARGGPGKR
jgi:hypothetical protein